MSQLLSHAPASRADRLLGLAVLAVTAPVAATCFAPMLAVTTARSIMDHMTGRHPIEGAGLRIERMKR